MPEDLESILRRVASGELSPADAEPLVAASTARHHETGPSRPTAEPDREELRPAGTQRRVTLKVMEGGRPVIHMRLPTAWASLAGSALPGLSGTHAERIREAIRGGETGPILDITDEDGDGVIISTE